MASQNYVFKLGFVNGSQLEAAFARLAESEQVGSCIIEPDRRQLLFQASELVARPLIERIYEGGALRWCSRHSLREFR